MEERPKLATFRSADGATSYGLVRGERHSRSVVYRADLQRFREVTLYLLKDCCGGRPDVCAPLIADLTPCCPPKEAA